MVLSTPWASVQLDSVSPTLTVVGRVMGSLLWDPDVPAYGFRGSTPSILEEILLAEGDMPLHMLL